MTVTPLTEEQRNINDTALILGIEQPFITWRDPETGAVEWIRDNRKWRNWLEAVLRVAEQHGRIPAAEVEGQGSLGI